MTVALRRARGRARGRARRPGVRARSRPIAGRWRLTVDAFASQRRSRKRRATPTHTGHPSGGNGATGVAERVRTGHRRGTRQSRVLSLGDSTPARSRAIPVIGVYQRAATGCGAVRGRAPVCTLGRARLCMRPRAGLCACARETCATAGATERRRRAPLRMAGMPAADRCRGPVTVPVGAATEWPRETPRGGGRSAERWRAVSRVWVAKRSCLPERDHPDSRQVRPPPSTRKVRRPHRRPRSGRGPAPPGSYAAVPGQQGDA
jgi:hypothetical protein